MVRGTRIRIGRPAGLARYHSEWETYHVGYSTFDNEGHHHGPVDEARARRGGGRNPGRGRNGGPRTHLLGSIRRPPPDPGLGSGSIDLVLVDHRRRCRLLVRGALLRLAGGTP